MREPGALCKYLCTYISGQTAGAQHLTATTYSDSPWIKPRRPPQIRLSNVGHAVSHVRSEPPQRDRHHKNAYETQWQDDPTYISDRTGSTQRLTATTYSNSPWIKSHRPPQTRLSNVGHVESHVR